jgi:FKBP-type peptidyl-prolyl cis-trans isomerase 2
VQKLKDILAELKHFFTEERGETVFSKPIVWLVIILVVAVAGGLTLHLLSEPGKGASVEEGSHVKFEWVARDDHENVIDTNILDVAEQARLTLRSDKYYQPLEIEVGKGEVIEGLEEALLGMKTGESKKVLIPPEKAYLNKKKEVHLPKYQSVPKVETMPIDEFEKKTGLKDYGFLTTTTHYLGGWRATITGLTAENVTLASMRPRENTTWEIFPGWTAKIIEVGENAIRVEQSPEIGLEFRRAPTAFPWFEQPYKYKVERVDDRGIILSYNPWEAIAEQDLWFEITVVEIIKVSEGQTQAP